MTIYFLPRDKIYEFLVTLNYVGEAQYYWAYLLFCKSCGLNILSDSEFMTKAC